MLAVSLAQAWAAPAPGPCRSRRAGSAGRAGQASRSRASLRVSAQVDDWAGRQFTLLSTGPAATEHLAATLAADRRLADAYCLKGDQGGGKTTFR